MITNTTIYVKHSPNEPASCVIEAYTPSGDAFFETCYEYDLPENLKALGQRILVATKQE